MNFHDHCLDRLTSLSKELNSHSFESDLSRMFATEATVRESCVPLLESINELDTVSKLAAEIEAATSTAAAAQTASGIAIQALEDANAAAREYANCNSVGASASATMMSEIEAFTGAVTAVQAASEIAVHARTLSPENAYNSSIASRIETSACSNLQAVIDANAAAWEYANGSSAATSATAAASSAVEAASARHFEQHANSVAASASSSAQSIQQQCLSRDLLEDWAPSVLDNAYDWADFVDKAKNTNFDRISDPSQSRFDEIWVDELARNSFRDYLSSESVRRRIFETSHELSHIYLPQSLSKDRSQFTPVGKLFSERHAKRILEYAFDKLKNFVLDGKCIFKLIKRFVDKRLTKVYQHSLSTTIAIQYVVGMHTWVRTKMIHSSTAPPKHGFLSQDFEQNRAFIGVEYEKSNRRSAIGSDQIDIRPSGFTETRYRENSATNQSAFSSWKLVRHRRFYQSCANGTKPFRSTCIEPLGDHIRVGQKHVTHLRSAA